MSQATTEFNINEIIGPLMLSAIMKGQDITPVIDALVNSKITEALIDKLAQNIPQEYADIVNVLKLAAQLDTLKAVMAAMQGKRYESKFGIDKVLEVVVGLQFLKVFGGGSTSGTTA